MAVVFAEDLATDRYAVARLALSTLPLSVVLVGAADAATRSCATGTAMYVSFAPPRIAIALHPGSRTSRLATTSGEFSVSVLAASQHEAATSAGKSAPGDDKFAALDLPVLLPPPGLVAPGLAGSPAVLWCRTTERLEVGDHVLFVGDVVAFDRSGLDDGGAPTPALLRQHRRYARLGEWLSDEAPEGYPT